MRHLADREYELSPLNIRAVTVGGELSEFDRRKKVALMGASLFANEAPLDDPEWEIWTCNLVTPLDFESRLRADRWFDLHQRVAQSADDLRWIAKCPTPIYLPPDLMDASPRAVRYPLEEIERAYGSYWSCTFAYQIALVLYEGVATDLGLYGIELAIGTLRERTVEWANTMYWLGRAEERGLNIHLPYGSSVGANFGGRYGFDYKAEIDAVKVYTRGFRRAEQLRREAGLKPDDETTETPLAADTD